MQCHHMSDFEAKLHQIRFPLGLRPRPPLYLRRTTSTGTEEVKGGGNGRGGKEGKKGDGEGEGKGFPDQCQTASYAPGPAISVTLLLHELWNLMDC